MSDEDRVKARALIGDAAWARYDRLVRHAEMAFDATRLVPSFAGR